MRDILKSLKGGLVVSCQALEHEPLHSAYIMSRMAYAAMLGGAAGIRCNSGKDIEAIKKTVDLPIIGLSKKQYAGYDVFITPTIKEVTEVVVAGADIVAVDATDRRRPDNLALQEFVSAIRRKYPGILLMGDVSKAAEGMACERLDFDLVSTTLTGYTEDTKDVQLPDFGLMRELAQKLSVPVIAEGGIWTPEALREAMDTGVHAAVVGTAITRPMEITKRFCHAIKNK